MQHVSISAESRVIFLIFFLFLSFDGESYQSIGRLSSAYSHLATYGMANYRGKALTTGCYQDQTMNNCGVKTELMDMNTLTWSAGPDYPFTFS